MVTKPKRYAFVFYMTNWREDLANQLRVAISSLEQNGGLAKAYDRYLVISEGITGATRDFCTANRLILQQEERFTPPGFPLPNKALMCRIPIYDLICLSDLDLVFLADPTPAFQEAEASQKIWARPDKMLPVAPWTKLHPRAGHWLRFTLGLALWKWVYKHFSKKGAGVECSFTIAGIKNCPPYFNTGVILVPGKYQVALGETWRYVSSKMVRYTRWRHPLSFFFVKYFLEQMAFALALHREDLPWQLLPPNYNLIPIDVLPDEAETLRSGNIVIAHMVSGIRSWLSQEEVATEVEPEVYELRAKVREAVKHAFAVSPSVTQPKTEGSR